MSIDYKARTKKALEGYFKKQDISQDLAMKPKQKRGKPEKLVEKDVLIWCKQKGFCVDVVEAKAVYSVSTGRYTGRVTSFGLSDIIGNTKDGLFVCIELKSPGRRVGSALHPRQREFLIKKIKTNAFAVMADSVAYIDKTWTHFCLLPTTEQRISYLLNELPDHAHRSQDLLFDE